MNVGIYFSNNPSEAGGGYTFEREILLSLLSLINESNHTFTFFSQRSIKNNIPQKNTKHIKNIIISPNFFERVLILFTQNFYPMSPFLKKLSVKVSNQEKYVRQNNIEIMIFCNPFHEAIDTPYITIVWDLQHRLQPWFPEVSKNGQWYEREIQYTHMLQRATYIIAGTRKGEEEVSNFYGIPKERIKLLPHPTPYFALTGNKKIKEDKFEVGTRYLIYPAQFWPHKNHSNILFALKIVKEKYKIPLSIVFVGSDKGNLSYIQKLIIDLHLTEEVRILGFVSREDLVNLYQNALALLYPTFFGPENLPPLEAFALGCPVIASKVSGSEEQLGDAALLVDPKSPEQIADAIFNLYNSPDLRKTLIERGLKRAHSWTGHDFIRGIFSILDEFEPIRRCWK